MTERNMPGPPEQPANGQEMNLEQLRALQHGVAAILMPVSNGWRIHYFSVPNFDDEPGTTFPTFQQAITALEDVLPAINSDAHRAQAHEDLRQRLRGFPPGEKSANLDEPDLARGST